MSRVQDFIILQKIGKGSYSNVFKVRRKSDNTEYALKKVSMGCLKEKEKENALNEVRILASINHPNMIAYKDAFFDEKTNSLCIVMEFANAGDLQKKIDDCIKMKDSIPESEIWKIISCVLRGLNQLHNRAILHRDIKCANIFISKIGDYKLGDLNVSKLAKQGLVYTQTGTPYYASPEVWRDEPYNASSDIWSLGCMIYELASLKPPFRAKDMEGLFKKVQKGQFDRVPMNYSNDLQKFIQLCLQLQSNQRPNCKNLLKSQLVTRNIQQVEITESKENIEVWDNDSSMLQTIKLPRNLKLLSNKMPKSKYNINMNQSFDQQSTSNYEKKLQGKSMSKTPLKEKSKASLNQKQKEVQECVNIAKRVESASRKLPDLQGKYVVENQYENSSNPPSQQQLKRNKSGGNLPLISNNIINKASNYHYHYTENGPPTGIENYVQNKLKDQKNYSENLALKEQHLLGVNSSQIIHEKRARDASRKRNYQAQQQSDIHSLHNHKDVLNNQYSSYAKISNLYSDNSYKNLLR